MSTFKRAIGRVRACRCQGRTSSSLRMGDVCCICAPHWGVRPRTPGPRWPAGHCGHVSAPRACRTSYCGHCCPLCLAGGGLESGLWLSLAPETRGELAGAVGASSALKDVGTVALWVGGKPVAPNTTGNMLGVLRSPNSQTLKGLWKEEPSN